MRTGASEQHARRARPVLIAWLAAVALATVALAPVWHHHGEHEHEQHSSSTQADCSVCLAVRTTGLDIPAVLPTLVAALLGMVTLLGTLRRAHLTRPSAISLRGPPALRPL